MSHTTTTLDQKKKLRHVEANPTWLDPIGLPQLSVEANLGQLREAYKARIQLDFDLHSEHITV